MRHQMKSCIAFTVILFVASLCHAQKKTDVPKSVLSGDPRCAPAWGVDRCTSDLYFGKVVEVLDGQTIVAILRNAALDEKSGIAAEQRTQLNLASISAPALGEPLGKEAKRNLKKLVLGKMVVAQRFCHAGKFTVYHNQLDLGLEQIKAGLARYESAKADAPSYTRCNYRFAEEKAKAENLGIWQNATK